MNELKAQSAVGSTRLLAELLAAAEWRRELLMDVRGKTLGEPDRDSLLLRAQALDDLACVCRIAMEQANYIISIHFVHGIVHN